MPRKLTSIGVIGALVLSLVGLSQNAGASGPSPANDAQSFCAVGHGAAGTCPAGFNPIDWDVCYDTGGGLKPVGLSCNTNTSDTSIPVGTGVPITSWQIISMPIGSRLASPVTYTPAAFGYATGIASNLTVATGDVMARTDLLCDGTLDIVARNSTSNGVDPPDFNPPPPGGPGAWPGSGWDAYNLYRDSLGDPNYAYIPQIQPIPSTFITNSMDVSRIVRVWLGGGVPIDIPPEPSPEGVTNPNLQGIPLVSLDTTSPYVAGLHVSTAILSNDPNPPNNLCLDSPLDSVATNLELIPPSVPGNYVRWANFESAPDLVSSQVTRLMIVRCLKVGGAAGTCDLADADGDGVPNAVEAVLGTDPNVSDTDADGSSDFDENFQFTDPGCVITGSDSNVFCPSGTSDTTDTDGDGSWDKQDDLSGLNCNSVDGVCTVPRGPCPLFFGQRCNGDTPAMGPGSDDNCPTIANPSQDNTDSLFDFTNTPNTPAGALYRGDATNPHQDNQGDACDRDMDNDGLDNVVEVGNAACISAGAGFTASGWLGTATASTATTMTDSSATWTVNQFARQAVGMHGSTATIISNTGTVLTIYGWTPPSPVTGNYQIDFAFANPWTGYARPSGSPPAEPGIIPADCGFNHANVAPGCMAPGVPVASCPGAGPAAGTLWCLPNGAAAPTGGMSRVETDPLNPDSDADGGLDGAECQFGSDPISAGTGSCNPGCVALNRYPAAAGGADPDGDLLFPDFAENFYRTSHVNRGASPALDDLEQGPSGVNTYNCPPATAACTPIPDNKIGPNDNDSDGDLLNDGVEVKWYGTSPANFDTDGDGCSDGREAADVNGDHKVNSTDSLAMGQHFASGALAPSPPYNVGGSRRDKLATYDLNKDGSINSTDQLLAAKLTGNCKFGAGAQASTPIVIGTKP